ncbi:MAG: hypothetical protein AAGD40_04155 [Pseudomonadota bacterium]
MTNVRTKTVTQLQTWLLNALSAEGAEADSLVQMLLIELAQRAVEDPGKHYPLTELGYTVRQKAWRAHERQKLLKFLLELRFPNVPYFQTWGAPGSAERRARIVQDIQAFIRRNRNLPEQQHAVGRWSADLAFLNSLPTPSPDAD